MFKKIFLKLQQAKAVFLSLLLCFSSFLLGGSVAVELPVSVKPYSVSEFPLEKENPSAINEFSDISYKYQKPPSSSKKKVVYYRSLLERLNKLQTATAFLEGQKIIMQSALRYKLKIDGASRPLYDLAVSSTDPSVRDDAVLLLVDQALRSSDNKALERIFNETQASLSHPLKSFIAVLLRRRDHISTQEAAYLITYFTENMIDQFQDSTTLSRIIKDLEDKIDLNDITRIINKFLASGQKSKALPFVRFYLVKSTASYEDIVSWGMRFGSSENVFVSMLRAIPNRTEEYQKYITFYEQRMAARPRGRAYNITLNRYRGIKKAPYNLEKTEQAFAEYIKGPIEDRYVTENAEKAVRNYLAFKRYDLIADHLGQIKEKIWGEFHSSYLNFWLAYSRLQLGETNSTIPLLTEIISKNPETYYSILSVNLLNRLFKAEPGGAEAKRELFNNYKTMLSSSSDNRLDAAVFFYYMGDRIAHSQAQKILADANMINNNSKNGISPSGQILADAYLSLGLLNNTRRILYREGIDNPYEQDIIFSSYFEENNVDSDFFPTYSRRKASLVGSMNRLIGNKALKAYYPRPFLEQVSLARETVDSPIDEGLIYAVIRTESFYKTNARSRVGARGLMQLMPATARIVARKTLNHTNYNLFDPKVNILLGTTYLSDNIKELGLLPAIAAYNGGPNRVLDIQVNYKPKNTFELIEVHPLKETRNYVRKVLESYNRYSIIYNGKALDLSQTVESLF